MSGAILPIDAVLPELVDQLRLHTAVVLRAPTGAGKTTRVPPALDQARFEPTGMIVMLEPRRLAARAAAQRIALECGVRLGAEVGYQVRFDRNWGAKTRILVVTPGILLRMLQDDPLLEPVSVVVLDEFHERGLENDLAFGMLRLVRQTIRPELRLLVMSATLDVQPIARELDNCPVVESQGRLFPVEIRHEPRSPNTPWPVAAAQSVTRLLTETPGDILVFLPGVGEIRQTSAELQAFSQEHDLLLLPLHGELPLEEQDRALKQYSQRKVVLATNVAESSVTVEGITAVIDTGLARMSVFDPSVGLDRLELGPIALSAADQRSGRAGRIQPGICIRLWSSEAARTRPQHSTPEIRRVDAAGALLQLLALGETDLAQFPWLDPPPTEHLDRAKTLLRILGLVDNHGLTDLGRAAATLPVHPRLARLLLEGVRWGKVELISLAAAILAERDPFPKSLRPPPTDSDLLERLEFLQDFPQRNRSRSQLGELNPGIVRFILRVAEQLRRLTQGLQVDSLTFPGRELIPPGEILGRVLIAAFPDRLVRRRETGSDRGLMVGGRGVRLASSSGVIGAELFVALSVDAGQSESFVRLASGIEEAWLPHEHRYSAVEVELDEQTGQVIARKRDRFLDLVIREHPAKVPEDERVNNVLLEVGAKQVQRVLPEQESAFSSFRLRLRCLREWMPELRLPALDPTELVELLPWLVQGCRSLDELRKADWLGALHGQLSPEQFAAVEREAPEGIQVPSGRRIALQYAEGKPPVLAVRIQELFGLHETPQIAGGRVTVILHLLAPNNRPEQVTSDLASFWCNTYPQVRKDLRGRYPKHAWPEDPLSAPAERGPRRRG